MNEELVIILRKIYRVLVVGVLATLTFTSIEVAEALFNFEGWDLLP